jgi:hypothetical protein
MSQELYFYTMLGYPLPLRSEFFVYQTVKNDSWRSLQAFRSWLHPPSEEMKSVCLHLQSRQWIRKYIPWIKSIYLCDEIVFNSYHDNLPIKFFLVSQTHQLWLVKIAFICIATLISFITKLHWKQRIWQLSVCIDENHQDFSHHVFPTSDPYLVYWIAHLVPYYHEDFTLQDAFIEKNSWLTYYLPNYQLRQTIFLPIDTSIGSTIFKRVITKLFSTWLFIILNALIYWCALSFWKLRKKEHLSSTKNENLAYYITQIDKRKRYSLEWELAKKVSQ